MNEKTDDELNQKKNEKKMLCSSKRISKLSIEEVDLLKRYRKGREKNMISIKLMCKQAKSLKDNFKVIKQNMVTYLENIESMIEERCNELENKVDYLENEFIIPDIEEIKNSYEQSKPKDEETFNKDILKNNLQESQIEIIRKFITCKKNLKDKSKYAYRIHAMQSINKCISKLHDFAENYESNLLKNLKEIRNVNYLKLISKLKDQNSIKSEEIEKIVLQVERSDFTSDPYEDRAQLIGFNKTISAPHMHALTLEMIKEHAQDAVKCLDIGFGSGWMTTVLSHLMKNENAICYGLDHLQGVLNIAKKNIMKNHRNQLESGRIVLVKGDGREGLEDYAPFDIIHLGAAATLKAVNKFIHQLVPNGILCGPIIKTPLSQDFMIIKKNADGQISKEQIIIIIQFYHCKIYFRDISFFQIFQISFNVSFLI